ncbi:GSCOCT00013076001.2-RA-CDS [Cotesia congregata]|uniref:Uncharacterized protein n=1 Tax=Cotesia congregata TaxID=51543 RepID=S6D4R4_COTCN|nr:GSCOCT00013076001.2-RA-CDS [Cotesia congregata]CCQ71169.1 hypothetical protein EP2-like4 [Cotesia congregata]
MLSTKAAVVLLVAIFRVSCADSKRLNGSAHPGLSSTEVPASIQQDNRQYPVTAAPLNGQGDGQPTNTGPKISYGSVTVQKGNTYAVDPASMNYYGSITNVDYVPCASCSHTPTSSDSKIKTVPGTTDNKDTEVILNQQKNHAEVMSEIAFLKAELETVNNLITRNLERAINILN